MSAFNIQNSVCFNVFQIDGCFKTFFLAFLNTVAARYYDFSHLLLFPLVKHKFKYKERSKCQITDVSKSLPTYKCSKEIFMWNGKLLNRMCEFPCSFESEETVFNSQENARKQLIKLIVLSITQSLAHFFNSVGYSAPLFIPK